MTRNLIFGTVALCLTLLCPASLAGSPTTVDSFTAGVNLGGWTYGRNPTYFPAGGSPDAYIGSTLNSRLPQLAASGTSVFTGDFRGRNVTRLGVDLIIDSVEFPVPRPVTLMLTNGSCSVYFEGAFVPQAGAGWVSFDYDLDPQSPTMPAGWKPFGVCTDPDVAWNTVIDNLTHIAFLYGDPTLFSTYPMGEWVLGADNPRLTEDNPWEDLGGGSSGINGQPTLQGAGLMTPGSSLTVNLDQAPLGGLVMIWIAAAPTTPVAAVGGTVHALPHFAQILAGTSFLGTVTGMSSMPAAVSGAQFTFQFICQDASTPYGLTLSNAVRGTVP